MLSNSVANFYIQEDMQSIRIYDSNYQLNQEELNSMLIVEFDSIDMVQVRLDQEANKDLRIYGQMVDWYKYSINQSTFQNIASFSTFQAFEATGSTCPNTFDMTTLVKYEDKIYHHLQGQGFNPNDATNWPTAFYTYIQYLKQ